MRRRTVLKGIGAAAMLAAAEAGYLAQQQDRRESPPGQQYIRELGSLCALADFHVHLGDISRYDPHALLRHLTHGITGVADNHDCRISNYEQLLAAPSVRQHIEEMDRRGLAQVRYEGRTGYLIRAQETAKIHHILAVGCDKYVGRQSSDLDIIKRIHDLGGIAILCHPKGVESDWLPYRYVDAEDERRLELLCAGQERVDEIEVFNAQLINLLPVGLDLAAANAYARKLADTYGYKGVANTDTHMRLEQMHRAGNYVPLIKDMTAAHVLQSIKSGRFATAQTAVSPQSFIQAHVVDRVLQSKCL